MRSCRTRLAWPLAGLLMAGCGSTQSLFPLEVGKRWSYEVKTSFPTWVEPVKVARSLSVAGVDGYELVGPLGTSRLAWTTKGLVAERLIGAHFSPPLPILHPGEEKFRQEWKGAMILTDRSSVEASAEQTQEVGKETMGSKRVDAVKSTVTLEAGPRHIELITWYVAGIGPVKQIQRTNGEVVVLANLLNSGQ